VTHSVCVGEHVDLSQLATEKVSHEEELIIRKVIELMEEMQ
jgi:hypothetical protein